VEAEDDADELDEAPPAPALDAVAAVETAPELDVGAAELDELPGAPPAPAPAAAPTSTVPLHAAVATPAARGADRRSATRRPGLRRRRTSQALRGALGRLRGGSRSAMDMHDMFAPRPAG
jgi:hypothetical protein